MAGSGSIFDRLRSLFGLGKQKPSELVRKTETPPKVPAEDTATKREPLLAASDAAHGPHSAPATRKASPPAAIRVASPLAVEVDLVLGIDFGTSCTKVAIGDAGWLGQFYAVPIGNGSGIAKFLRTTQLQVGNQTEGNLKMRLMEKPGSVEVQNFAALYLAGVVQESIKWFSSHGPGRYKERQPVWSLNLGFPAKRVDVEKGALATAYFEVAKLGAELGSSDLPLTLDSLVLLRNQPRADHGQHAISSARIGLYPEIAAQLASYVNSPFRTPGNLILVDVGAGTLDVSTAILHETHGEDIMSFHCCEVVPYGAAKLMAIRMAALEEVRPGSVKIEAGDFQSGTEPTPEIVAEFVGAKRSVREDLRRAFDFASDDFASQAISQAIRCAARFRKLQRDGHSNPSYDPWPGYVRFFFTGGGSRLCFYRHHFVDGHFEQELTRFTRWKATAEERRQQWQGLRLEALPPPNNFKGFPTDLSDHFDRLSVAHGLAYGRDNLMKVTASEHS